MSVRSAQMRRVLVAFAELRDVGLEGDGDDVAVLHSALLRVLEALSEHGGQLRQMLADDKGCVIMVTWGLPGSPCSEQKALAGIQAARRALVNQDIDVRFGATASPAGGQQVYCGALGTSARGEYGV